MATAAITSEIVGLDNDCMEMKKKIVVKPLLYTFNISGTLFNVTEEIVLESTYLKAVGWDKKCECDLSDRIIDRDPIHFSYIINCIRDLNYIQKDKLVAIKPELV